MNFSRTDRVIFTCDVCSRAVRIEDIDDYDNWLISDKPLAKKFMARCPQHITNDALYKAGVPRNKTFLRWAREVKEKDPYKHRPMNEALMPYTANIFKED